MTLAELRLFSRLLAIANDQKTIHGHRAMIGPELAGYCKPWKACYPKCDEFKATLAEAEALIAEAEAGNLVQMELREAS
jgi:hypothetical protein